MKRFSLFCFLLVLLFSTCVMPTYALATDEFVPDPKRDTASELVVYKDANMTEKYASVDDIPKGTTVYYEIVSEPGYICHDIEMNVYEITDTYFVNDYHGTRLDYTLKSVLAGDTNLSGTYNLNDVTNILKYIAGYTVQYWNLAKSVYGECIMDYNCDGKVSISDASGVLKDIAGWDIDRVKPCPRTYGLKYLLSVESESVYGVCVENLGDNGYAVEYTHYNMDAYGLSDKYDEAFFETHDIVIFCGYCPGDTEPVIEKLWYNSDTGYIEAEFECSNIQFGSGWTIFVPVAKELGVIPNYPV